MMQPEARGKFPGVFSSLAILALRAILIVMLIGAGWFVYRQLPYSSEVKANHGTTNVQIVLRQPENEALALDVAVSLYPVDVVAVRHEFFTEPRAGKRLEDFLKERMKGRSPVSTRLDRQGQGAVLLSPGTWWLHASLSGDEQLEWRLPVTVTGPRQVIELTSLNAYTRSKSF